MEFGVTPFGGLLFGPRAVYWASFMLMVNARSLTQSQRSHTADRPRQHGLLAPTMKWLGLCLSIVFTACLPAFLCGCNLQDRQGEFRSLDGSKYVGQFRDGQPNGRGTITYTDGSKYVGEVRDGTPDGHGVFARADGWKCIGEFRDGKVEGRGTLLFLDGGKEKYVGEFKNGRLDGTGTFTWADGRKYAGQFRDGRMDGQGEMVYPDGKVEQGLWKDDRFVGVSSSS